MEFVKIKAAFKYGKDRLYRILYVRSDITLIELGCVLLNALGAKYEHFFLFRDHGCIYNPISFLDMDYFDGEYPMYKYKMWDLNNKFEFTYDTGDGWDFDITVYQATKDFDVDPTKREHLAFIKEGKGQGIWEDNIYSLYAYFAGEIKPDSKENKRKGYYFPWNFEIKQFGDFDTDLNLDEIQKELDAVSSNIQSLMDPEMGYVPEQIRKKKSLK